MSDPRHQEIIIIKRGNEEEEGHHGGAWKIAFADFMTAMMALFLVLWLINAANEETKRAVASYFNPIKLVDRNRSVKGIEEQKGGPAETDETGGAPNADKVMSDEALITKSLPSTEVSENKQQKGKDAAFFEDPMAALDRIEASILEKQSISNKTETKGEDSTATKFTDPFNPDFFQTKPAPGSKVSKSQVADGTTQSEKKRTPEPTATNAKKAQASTLLNDGNEAQLNAVAAELERSIRQEIAKELGAEAAGNNSLKVMATENGILIQIADLPTSPMFDIGAAVPKGETVIAINAVAKAIGRRPGPVHVYGHTDARKYGGPGNGNWRLSLDRAQSVYFILLRAGLAESRFAEVSGFADRNPVVANDPLADQNRRIEIFLEQP